MKIPRRLIILEPHAGIRELMVDYLAWLGFDAFEAAGVTEAARMADILRNEKEPYTFLVSDRILAQRLLTSLPSGKPGEMHRILILQSPFSPRELRQALLF